MEKIQARFCKKANFWLIDFYWNFFRALDDVKVKNLYPEVTALLNSFTRTRKLFFHEIWHGNDKPLFQNDLSFLNNMMLFYFLGFWEGQK